jgi:hypothetical protein
VSAEIIETRLIGASPTQLFLTLYKLTKMPHRLPDDVVHRILVRLSALEPVPSIAAAVVVANEIM